jgi:hypothetical protein
MAATTKKKAPPSKEDLKRLMREKQGLQKAKKTIHSPLAKYPINVLKSQLMGRNCPFLKPFSDLLVISPASQQCPIISDHGQSCQWQCKSLLTSLTIGY